jgi:hypothetical protein
LPREPSDEHLSALGWHLGVRRRQVSECCDYGREGLAILEELRVAPIEQGEGSVDVIGVTARMTSAAVPWPCAGTSATNARKARACSDVHTR